MVPLMVQFCIIGTLPWNLQGINEPFITPDELSDNEDLFTNGDMEYVFANYPMDHFQAGIMCNGSYGGRLAVVDTYELALFLAEALSETNLFMDVLWVGSIYMNHSWYWDEGDDHFKPLSPEMAALLINCSELVNPKDRKCLSMGRKFHDLPHLPQLKCSLQRAIMCERPENIPAAPNNHNGSTHPGWIRIGPRLYKIFQEKVPWVDAVGKCIAYDREARLAVVVSFADAQALGRYLLVGRPSLENAWLGAKYYSDHYKFPQESLVLANKSDEHGYPPWRNGTMRKVGGCILLDRHLSNTTFFIEARCDRLRPYICYKKDKDDKHDDHTDVIIGNWGYRLYFNKVEWQSARYTCNIYKKKYHAKLAEISSSRSIVRDLICVMGENKRAVQHIWLGGLLDGKLEKWVWDSDNSLVKLDWLNWLVNSTYFDNVEKYNTCLNMDRENHLRALHYGTICDFPQNFVCMFPKDDLIQLEKDEGNNVTRRVFRRVFRNNTKNSRAARITHNPK